MYSNLKAEMARHGITLEKLSQKLGINIGTLSAKLNVYNRLKLCEAIKIRDEFFPDTTIDYLFKTERR